ncbi:MAG TPA: hypothetical protein DCZ69_06265 [Syntrophobacteraceae bacterium]|nr:hypothetical protein [Syntrophobacteraceae bacterium]
MVEVPTLLTIDDEEAVRRSIRVFFEDSGFEVQEAGDGRTGLEIFREKKPGVVLVDLRMPGMSGLEVIQALSAESPETPVITLSGTGMIGDAIEAIRRGAWDYVTKPILDMAELEHVVNMALERARLRRESRQYNEHLEQEVARRSKELHELNERLKTIVRSTRAVTGSGSVDETARQLLVELAANVGANGGSFYLVEDSRLVLKHALDPAHAEIALVLPLPLNSVLGRALAEKVPILIRDVAAEDSIKPSGWASYRDGSLLAFPLLDHQSQAIGVAALHNKGNPPFTEQDREVGAVLASYAIEAIRASRASETLSESEEKYRDLVENINDAIYVVDDHGTVTYVSPAVEKVLGYPPQEIMGRHFRDFFPSREWPRLDEAFQNLLHGKVAQGEYLVVNKAGEPTWARTSSRPAVREGRVIGFQGTLTDISATKIAERSLAERVHELAVLNDLGREMGNDLSMDSAVGTALKHAQQSLDPDVLMLFLRQEEDLILKGFAAKNGCHRSDSVPMHRVGDCLCGLAVAEAKAVFSTDIHLDPRCTMAECRAMGFKSFAAVPLESGSETIGILGMASSDNRCFEDQASFLDAFGHTVAIGLKNAILYEKAQEDALELQTRLTQIQKAEQEREGLTAQLQQAQKMEAIGTLAGGIAHDFNNILTPIIMGAELALMTTPEENRAHPLLERVISAGMRAKDLVQQILTFSRQSDLERKPLRLIPTLKETLKLARAAIPSTIEIRQDIVAKEDLILANPTQVHQVVMNLVTNAAHAMREEGGILEIELREEHLDESNLGGLPELVPGHFVVLTVRDTGRGMDRRTMEQIFDPFFTTKERGEGTGLGLSIVHGIIRSYNGAIRVESRLGEGTRFDIFIPVERTLEAVKKEEHKPIPRGTERILLVDDEPMIVEIHSHMLRALGYQVTSRLNVLDALQTFRNDPHGFDLVITDMTMPHMTGDKLAAEILRIRPGVPVILCTGFSERVSKEMADELGIRALVTKPVGIADIAGKIRDVLGRA